MAYSITQNTTLLTGASILQKIVSFVYFTLIARLLGAENTSQYFLALSFALIFTVVADFGLTTVLTREVSKYPKKAKKYLNSIFWVKLLLGLVTYFLIVITANILNYPELTKQLIYIAGITVFFDNLTLTAYAFFRAHKNLFYESASIFLSQLTTLAIGTVVLLMGWPMIGLIIAFTIPSFINFLICLIYLKKKYNFTYSFTWNKQIVKLFLGISIPFALAGIISRLYSYTDTLIMSKILSSMELGWWSVPYKLIFAFKFIPAALTISIFPVISHSYLKNKEIVERLFRKAWSYLIIISIPMAFGLYTLAKPLILKIYTAEYLPAVPVLQILGFAIVFIFLGYINGTLLNAIDKQKLQTKIIGSAWILSIILNLILIPKFGIIGAAWASLCSNIFFTIVGYYFINKFINLRNVENIKIFIKSLLSAIVMSFIIYYTEFKFNFIIAIPVGIITYFLILYLLKGYTKEMVLNNLIKLRILKAK